MKPEDYDRLERRLRRTQYLLTLLVVVSGAMILIGTGSSQPEVSDVVRTNRLVVVDDKGVARVVIGQDAPDAGRRSRAAGITIYDALGHERGGFSTMDDGSVVLALDAPVGVGSAMRDRIGIVVWPNGASYVMLLDNQSRAVAKLHSNGEGGGGVQVFDWDMDQKIVRTKTIRFDDEVITEKPFGQ